MPNSVLTRQRSWVARIAVLAMLASLLVIGAVPAGAAGHIQDTSASCPSTLPSAGFTDIGSYDATTQAAINCIAAYGISKGTSATTYGGDISVARWQMALFLTRQAAVHGVALPSGADQGFTDISGLDAATQTAINQLAQLGISKGTSATTFAPTDNVTREQMALFLTRLLGAVITLPASPADAGFTDVAGLSAESQLAINQLAELGVAAGTSATTYAPAADVLRWQMALFLTRVLAADGIRPAAAVPVSNAPQLLSVTFDDDDADQTRVIYKFDEDVALTGGTGDFQLVDVTGTRWDADEVDKWSDDEIEVIFDNDYIDVATVAVVHNGAVENIDGDDNPAGSYPWENYTLDGADLPGNDAPEVVAVGAFNNTDDTVELEFDQDMDGVAVAENLIYFVEEDGTVWPGDAAGANNDSDDEIVYVELLGNPGTADFDNFVRVFLAPNAAAGASPPHSVDIAQGGETDEAPSLSDVTIDRTAKEVTFTFNRSVVDEAYTPGDFVLVTITPSGAYQVVTAAAAGDLDRDTATTIVWDTDDGGLAEQAMARLIVYAGVWDSGGVGTTLDDFATGETLEVGHFVNFSTSFTAGTTAAPQVLSSAGSATGLAGDEFDIVLTMSMDMDNGDVFPANLQLFESNGDEIDPTWASVDTDDEEVTITLDDADTGFDELDDGDVAVLSYDAGFAVSPGGYQSFPQSGGCGC